MATSGRVGRPRGATLDQRQVVEAARQLASGGLKGLTMARVAGLLGVTPMAVYRHVKDKDELLELVLNDVFGEVVLPDEGLPWDLRLRTLQTRVVASLTTYPGTAERLGQRHRVAPNAVRLLHAYLSILTDAGLDERDAVSAYTALYYLAIGQAVDHATQDPATPAARADMTLEQYPLLGRLLPVAESLGRGELQAFALDALLDGIRLRVEAASLNRDSSRTS
jgi:AcrR family transcriptional regulator